MKTLLKASFCMLFLSLFSCQKENGKPLISSSQNQVITAHYIGEAYGGGIIYYLDTTNEHGLIAATQDQGIATWYNGEFIVTGAVKSKIGVGLHNTKLIVDSQGVPGNYAARLCTKYTAGGYSKWYLPSSDELQELWRKKDIVGGFVQTQYWASSEDGAYYAVAVSFDSTGGANIYKKDVKFHVRAIRSF